MSGAVLPALNEIVEEWGRISKVIRPVQTERDYRRLSNLLNEVLDRTGGDERHPLASLAEVLGLMIEEYESQHLPEPKLNQGAILRYLMEEHHLTAADLPELDSEEHILEIIGGTRRLALEQIITLSRRFHISPDVFIRPE